MLSVERTDAWVFIRLDRPEVGNAINDELVAKFLALLAELRDDESVRALVIGGTGKIFSAGADLNWMRRMQEAGPEENRRDAERTAELFTELYNFPRPVVAAVNGPARGGGVGLVASCDFAIATPDARFADTHCKVGLFPRWGGGTLLPSTVGVRRARQMMLTGAVVGASTALAWGLINEIVPREQLIARCAELAEEITALRRNQPLTFQLHKDMLDALAMPEAASEVEQAMMARYDEATG